MCRGVVQKIAPFFNAQMLKMQQSKKKLILFLAHVKNVPYICSVD